MDSGTAKSQTGAREVSSRNTNPKKPYSIRLSDELIEKYRLLARIRTKGEPKRTLQFVLEQALTEWMETNGTPKLEFLQRYLAGDRMQPSDLPSPEYTIEDAAAEKVVLDHPVAASA